MSADDQRMILMREWLRYAEGDLVSARALAANPDLPARNACYLAQQCAEKALKAALIAAGIDVVRTHDLDALVYRFPAKWKDRFSIFDLSWLSEWSVESRYPGDWPEATIEDATRAIDMADGVYSLVKALVGLS